MVLMGVFPRSLLTLLGTGIMSMSHCLGNRGTVTFCSMYVHTCKYVQVWMRVSVYIWQPEAVASLPW